MRQKLQLIIDPHDQAQLNRGRGIELTIGETPVTLLFGHPTTGNGLAPPSPNRRASYGTLAAPYGLNNDGTPRKIRRKGDVSAVPSSGICSSCKRNLRDPYWKGKHSPGCRVLRQTARAKAKKGRHKHLLANLVKARAALAAKKAREKKS
jgi:hypothetical protein